jgi:hypothetical protein
VAIGVLQPNSIPTYRTTEPSSSLRLQQLIDTGTVYVAQNLSPTQFATLQAIAALILRPSAKNFAAHIDATLSTASPVSITSPARTFSQRRPLAFDWQLGLNELDIIARTHTGYPFADLPTEIQDALLGLIASRDLTTRKLDLALWLEDLHTNAAASF